MKRVLLIALLLVPVVVGEDTIPGHVRVVAPITVGNFTALDLDTAGQQVCGEAPREATGLAGVSRPESHVTNRSVNGRQILVFQEDEYEYGCAEARYRVTVPEGAAALELSFLYDRQFALRGETRPAGGDQWVTLYNDGDIKAADLPPLSCLDHHAYVDPDEGALESPEPGLLTVQLSDCDEPLGDALIVGFGFADRSTQDDPALLAPTVPAGQAFVARVQDPVVAFKGIVIPVAASERSDLDPERQHVNYKRFDIDVAPVAEGQRQEVAFKVSNDHTTLGLYKADGDLQRVDDRFIKLSEGAGDLEFVITAEVIDEWGPGPYAVLFAAPGTGQVSDFRLPLAALALLAPLAAGVVAQRNLNHLQRSARGRLRGLRRTLQVLLGAAWVLYITVAFLLFVGDAGMAMAADPMPARNVAAYIALGTSATVMVVVAVVSRRKEMAIVLDDLSELERIQAELERSNRELEQFAYVASHDLKEPLRMVAGYTELLEMRYGKSFDEQGKEFLDFAAEGAQRLQRMVDDLLAYSRVRTDHDKWRPVRLDDVVTIVRGHLRALIKERDVRLVAGDLPLVYGDQGQLVQLLLNLVQNAIKFSPQDSPLVEISARAHDDGITLSVRDEGIGIDPKQQQRIFDIFQRLHLREEYEGNGIGLAMCKKIAEQLGGSVQVESAPGEGSTFHVFLPDLSPGATPQRSPHPSDSAA